jgi:predicted acylesterase/phospholipase RssA
MVLAISLFVRSSCNAPARQVKSFSTKTVGASSLRPKCRILSIDGGGIRGIIPGSLLVQMEKMAKKPIAQQFDLIAGTSTGGILATGVSLPIQRGSKQPKYKASQVLDFYLDKGFTNQIFQKAEPLSLKISRSAQELLRPSYDSTVNHHSPKIELAGLTIESDRFSGEALGSKVFDMGREQGEYYATILGRQVCLIRPCGEGYEVVLDEGGFRVYIPKDSLKDPFSFHLDSKYEKVREWVKPRYQAAGIETALKEKFGEELRLSDLIPQEVFVAAFNTSKMRHHLWSKSEAMKKPGEYPDIKVWKAARSTSAAPMYFPAFNIHGEEYVDGGICMNDPVIALYTQALKLGFKRKEIYCISLGTGRFVTPLAPTTNYGGIHWLFKVFDTACQGMASQTEDYMRNILPKGHYLRINPVLRSHIPLDGLDPTSIDALKDAAKSAFEDTKNELQAFYEKMKD